MKVAFAGLRHGHIYMLYDMVKNHKDFEILGAFEDDAAARQSATAAGVECNYATYDELLADQNVEAVALGGCFAHRGPMAIKALQAGKHVIVDKPLCTSLEQLDQIDALSKQTGKAVSCMFTMRYEKKINALKKLVESGALGEINNVYFGGQHPLMYGRRPDWYFEKDKYGGLINDIAIHGIDILAYALGLKISEVCSAREWNKFAQNEPDFKDSAQFMLKTENNGGVLADVSYAVPDGVEFALPYYWQFFVWGTKGTISLAFNEEKSYYFVAGDKTPHLLEEDDFTTDYLTDFINLVQGKKDVILSVDEVIYSTRKTLEIQQQAQ